jgi:oxygen-dependent protoporphyrinogen oxidase
MTPAHVVGAGLSGLVTAWHLVDAGFDVAVSDAAEGPGGLIQTRHAPHGLIETAANAFVWTETVQQWFDRLEIVPVFPRDDSKRRYIFRNGRPRRWPLSIGESASMAARLALALTTRQAGARDRETVAQWGDRVVGAGARAWLLEPAMQGIYGSPATALSAKAIFSGRRRGKRRMVTPAAGMCEFTTRLHARLEQRGVRFDFSRTVQHVDAGTPTAICTDAGNASRLLSPHAPDLAARLAAVGAAPLTTVTMFFEPHPADLHGFGVLFPAASGVQALGVLFNADIFNGRGSFRSETWIVGDRAAGMTTWPDAQLLAALANDRYGLTGRRAEPAAWHVTRWPRAVPIYNQAVLDVQKALGSLPPWVALAGNYLGQIGVAALLEHGQAAAARLSNK